MAAPTSKPPSKPVQALISFAGADDNHTARLVVQTISLFLHYIQEEKDCQGIIFSQE